MIAASKAIDQKSWLAIMDGRKHLSLGGKNLS